MTLYRFVVVLVVLSLVAAAAVMADEQVKADVAQPAGGKAASYYSATPVNVTNSVLPVHAVSDIRAKQSGSWEVGAKQCGPWAVNVDGGFVYTPTLSKTIIPWPREPIPVNTGDTISSGPIDCRGFKQMRVFLVGGEDLQVQIFVHTPEMRNLYGRTFFLPLPPAFDPVPSLVEGSFLDQERGTCVFAMPVLSDVMSIDIILRGPLPSTEFQGQSSQIYLTN